MDEACGESDYDCNWEEMVERAYCDVNCGDGDSGRVCRECGDTESDKYEFYYGDNYDEEEYRQEVFWRGPTKYQMPVRLGAHVIVALLVSSLVGFGAISTLSFVELFIWRSIEIRMGVMLMVGIFGGEERRKHTGTCIDCGNELELYMLDLKKGRRVLQCTQCGLYHFYKKDMLGKWKVVKAAKIPDLWSDK